MKCAVKPLSGLSPLKKDLLFVGNPLNEAREELRPMTLADARYLELVDRPYYGGWIRVGKL